MARTCRYSLDGAEGAAEWQLDDTSLVLLPQGGSPLIYAIRELRGISSSDGYEIRVLVPGGAGTSSSTLVMSRLGADGPTMLEQLRRTWLPARADALRLAGSGEAKPFTGQVAGLAGGGDRQGDVGAGGGAGPSAGQAFAALLHEDVLLVARDGQDVEPVFLSSIRGITFDEASYTVRIECWTGAQIVVSRLAARTQEFLDRLQRNRSLLTKECSDLLAANLPVLAGGARTVLAAVWPPGRLLDLASIERAAPGFTAALRASWLPALPRQKEGEAMLGLASPDRLYLGTSRPGPWDDASSDGEADAGGADTAPAGGSDAGLLAGQAGAGAGGTPAGAPQDDQPATSPEDQTASLGSLWLLLDTHDSFFLECLSSGGRATYRFSPTPEMPSLISQLLSAPQFSREALYLPLESLVGDRADLAIAAQNLPFLAELRRRFSRRIIHGNLDRWRKELGT